MRNGSQSTIGPPGTGEWSAAWRWLAALLVASLLGWLVVAMPAAAQEDDDGDATPTETEEPAANDEAATGDDIPAEPADLDPVDDATAGLEVVEDVNFRAEPSLDAEILTVIPAGSEVTPVAGADAENDFLPVSFDGQEGWAHAAYLVSGGDNLATVEEELNLRANPNTDGEVLLVMPAGAEVRVFGSDQDDDGAFWSRVRYEETTGWAATEFLAAGGAGNATAASEETAGSELAGQERIALDDLNLRAGPTADDEVLLVIPAGGSMTLTGEGLENGYVTATFDGTAGWVAAVFIARPDELADSASLGTETEAATDADSDTESVASDLNSQTRVTLDDLNLRAGASAEDEVLAVIPAGATVTLTGEGAENGYVTVEYERMTGWVAAEFLDE